VAQDSPFAAHAEDVKLLVIADQGQIFVDGLRRKHSVEGVFVLRGQTTCPQRVFEADWEREIACRLDGRNEIIDEGLSFGEFA